jgi:hypothetical protein
MFIMELTTDERDQQRISLVAVQVFSSRNDLATYAASRSSSDDREGRALRVDFATFSLRTVVPFSIWIQRSCGIRPLD